MIRWTGLEFEFPFPGSLTSTFLEQLMANASRRVGGCGLAEGVGGVGVDVRRLETPPGGGLSLSNTHTHTHTHTHTQISTRFRGHVLAEGLGGVGVDVGRLEAPALGDRDRTIHRLLLLRLLPGV